VVFEADYDEIELQNIVRHKNFSNLGPSQSKFLATPVVLG